MAKAQHLAGPVGDQMEIIAFRLQGQEFRVMTRTIREIRETA